MGENPAESVVITGIGAITAFGAGTGPLIDGLLSGRTGIRPIEIFDTSRYRTKVAAEISTIPELELNRREQKGMSRCDRLAVTAAEEALRAADWESIPSERIGIVFGAGAGGMLEAERYFRRFLEEGATTRARWRCLGSQLPNAATDWLAVRFGTKGPKATISTACSSSATAIGYGADLIRAGEADAILAGGAEALCEVTFAGFNSLRAVDPAGCRPFDRDRNGLSLGEGAAAILLERESLARSRGVKPLARMRGYGITADAHHMTTPPEDGRGATAAIRQALRTTGLEPEEVDFISAHGTATRANDVVEARAIARTFGESAAHTPVHSIKSSVGHCLGASGAVEAVALLLSLESGAVPATYGLEHQDESMPTLDLVRGSPRRRPLRIGMSNSFAFGGNNTVLIFEGIDS
ncbi:MAG: beta-ketoacyl-[acyl-carrier-protein] synthase family protein [Planctomycetota bacterium]|nr:beta-ketoacyl-[acyl-carrier-protein] synthase family protein [Planctomycetota bacterium]